MNARLSRRELLKLGLVMGGAGLLARSGLRHFRSYWAHAESLALVSPPNTPFADPLLIPPVMQETLLDPAPTIYLLINPHGEYGVVERGEST